MTAAATTDSLTYTSNVRALVRCTRKGCRKTYRASFTTTTTDYAFDGRPAQTRTVTIGGRESSYRDRHDLHRLVTRDLVCECGGEGFTFDVISGSFSEAVKCGARCRNAVGPSCECSCRGERHGESHTAI
jgi:hypothetical protein